MQQKVNQTRIILWWLNKKNLEYLALIPFEIA